MSLVKMDWFYYRLVDGRLIDDDGNDEKNFPSFSSVDEAEEWLVENDIRGNVKPVETKSGAELYTNIMSEEEQEKLKVAARLIKAAPKMLEMLETIVILYRLHKNSTDWEKVLEEAAELIKKTRGEQ